MANLYKNGLDMFPSHFEFHGLKYELSEPEVLRQASKVNKKKSAFLLVVLSQVVADGKQDRLTILALGLTTAGKVPFHWSDYYGEDSESAWSETEDED